jgi:hypothetical protein
MFPDVRQLTSTTAIQVVAYSSTRVDVSDEEVVKLVLACGRRNHAFRITGELWFGETRFFQLFEGDPARVQKLYENLRRDPRHCDMVIYHDSLEPTRRCANFTTHVFDGDESQAIERLIHRFVSKRS